MHYAHHNAIRVELIGPMEGHEHHVALLQRFAEARVDIGSPFEQTNQRLQHHLVFVRDVPGTYYQSLSHGLLQRRQGAAAA